MRPYEIRRADEIRSQLILLLGGKCEHCGTPFNLEFNHKHPRTWRARSFNRYQRMLRYHKEYRKGLITLLCETCNRKYRPVPLTHTSDPF